MESRPGIDTTPRFYAFLDLDETLIDTEAKHFNHALLDTLEQHGVKDLVLFTSMDARQILNDLDRDLSRPRIIEELERNNRFRVHMVITPPDVYYDAPGFYYTYRWLPEFNRVKKQFQQPEIEQFKIELDQEMKKPEALRNLQRIAELRAYPGVHVQHIDDEHTRELLELEKRLGEEMVRPEKDFQKIDSIRFQMHINKGRMLTVALNHVRQFPGMTGIILAEDRKEEVVHVIEANACHANKIPLAVIAIQTKDKATSTCSDVPTDATIDTYDERKEAIMKRYYDAMPIHLKLTYLKLHLNSPPLLQARLSGIVRMRELLDRMDESDEPVAILIKLKQIAAESGQELNLFKAKSVKEMGSAIRGRLSPNKENAGDFYEFVRATHISPRALEDAEPHKNDKTPTTKRKDRK